MPLSLIKRQTKNHLFITKDNCEAGDLQVLMNRPMEGATRYARLYASAALLFTV